MNSTFSKNQFTKKKHNINGQPVAIRQSQKPVFNHRKKITTVVMTPSPNVNSLEVGSQIKFFIENQSVNRIETLTLRFQVQINSNASKLASVEHWFNEIQIIDRTSGVEICRYHDDVLKVFNNIIDTDKVKQHNLLKNTDTQTYKSSDFEHQTDVGGKYYYLPLIGSVFDGSNLDMTILSGDIEIRLIPRTGGIISSGGGNTSLLEVAAIVSIDDDDMISRRSYIDFHNSHVMQHNFLNSQKYEVINQAMNSGTQYSFDLDAFDHVSAGLLLAIRPTGSNVNLADSRNNYMDLTNSLIDVVSSSGVSVYSSGRPIDTNYIKHIKAPRHTTSDFFEKVHIYPVMFGDLINSIKGVVDGYHKFQGEKYKLQITTTSKNNINQEIVFNNSAIPDAGFIVVTYKGVSTAPIAFNASANALSNALTDLSTSKKESLVWTFDNPLNSALTTATLSNTSGQAAEWVKEVSVKELSSYKSAGVNVDVTLDTDSDPPEKGWVNGNYDIEIYSLYHRNLYISKGKIGLEDF